MTVKPLSLRAWIPLSSALMASGRMICPFWVFNPAATWAALTAKEVSKAELRLLDRLKYTNAPKAAKRSRIRAVVQSAKRTRMVLIGFII
jgi:hypothetical protein